MKICLSISMLLLVTAAFGQLKNKEIRDLKAGRVHGDTSFVYSLPFEKGKSFLLVQGSNSKFSHKASLAFEFKMRSATPICAARPGIVTAMRADSDKRGLKDENLSDGNYIFIKHDDGSEAQYWHLQTNSVFVKVGDSVSKNQVIGLSGKTGYSAFPHLHFQVTDQLGKEILPRFITSKGIIYLRPGKWYRSI